MIEFKGIYKKFEDKVVLAGVDLIVDKGKITFIIGTSGVGKSVLVKIFMHFLGPEQGRIFFNGQDITDYSEKKMAQIRKRCAMVFQHSTLFDSMTVYENIALPFRYHFRKKEAEISQAVTALLKLVQIEADAEKYPSELGFSSQKKVAIARALTLEPDFIIFDEPTTGMDPVSAVRIDHIIKELSDKTGVTSIVISHDLRSIFSIADRICLLYKGKIQLDGTPLDFRNSPDPIVKQFIHGNSNGPIEL